MEDERHNRWWTRRGGAAAAAALLAAGCAPPAPEAGGMQARREAMVKQDLVSRGINDPKVLSAMETVERHRFVPAELQDQAYADRALPIGRGQTISQPYIVALMTELLELKPGARVLEVGTGSGYQAAVLSLLARHVYTVEIVEPLAREAEDRLRELGYTNVTVRAGDGYEGGAEHAPFDAIMVTAAPDHVPSPLVRQLAAGGRMVIPVGPVHAVQDLRLLVKRADGAVDSRSVLPVRFVPVTRPSNPAE